MLSSSPAPKRKMKKGNITSGQNIKVFVRVRPMNEGEKLAKASSLVQCPTNKEVVIQERPLGISTKTFSFDRVFGIKSKQVDIYNCVARPLVDEVLKGFNCTIFAYGQTGTGKTFTMEGDHYNEAVTYNDENLSSAGIIPRCVNQLFDELRIQKHEFTMKVSFLELYNEELFDLLSPSDCLSKLRLFEDSTRKGSCIVSQLEEVHVRTKGDVYNIIEKGSAKRQTAATLMNAHSSRSHTIFTVTVIIKEPTLDGDELMKTGKLHLVDLAGSENIGRSGAVDKRAREAGNINQSLLTLGRVITALMDKTPHVPYRESKLTRLLQDALGGRTKTSIIATISPSSTNLEETLSTLDYAHRAKNIQNRPEVNQRVNKKELISEYTNEIEKMRRDLLAMREKSGVYLANENYEEMMQTMDQQANEIIEKIAQVKALEEELQKQIELFSEKNDELYVVNEKLNETESMFSKTKEKLRHVQSKLSETTVEREEQKYLVSAHVKTESLLHSQGKSLINCAETAVSDISRLHDKLDRKKKIEHQNEEVEKNFMREQEEKMSAMHASIQSFKKQHQLNSSCVINTIDGYKISSSKSIDSLKDQLSSMVLTLTEALENSMFFFKEKNEDSQKACSNFLNFLTDKTKEEEKIFSDFLAEILHPMFSKLTDIFSSQQRSLQTLQDTIKVEMTKFGELCDENSKVESSILDDIQNQLDVLTEYPSVIIGDMSHKSRKMEEISKNHLQKILEQSRGVASSIEEFKNLLNSEFPLLPPENEEILLKAEKSSKEILQSVRTVSDHSIQHAKQCIQNSENATALLCSKISQIELQNEEIGKDTMAFETKLEEKIGLNQEILQNISSRVKDFENLVTQMSETSTTGLQKKLEESGKIVKNSVDSEVTQLQNLKATSESTLSNISENILHYESELDEFLSDHSDQLKENQENICTLLSEVLVKDTPTGNTPARKEYSYPSSLAATSPHETLINRFRIRNMPTKIPVPQNNTDIEDTNSSSNSESTYKDASIGSEVDSLNSEDSDSNDILPKLKNKSLKNNEASFAIPILPFRQECEEIPKITFSRSASASSLIESKENINTMNISRSVSTKKRKLKQPSVSTSSLDKLPTIECPNTRARKVLGLHN